MITTPKFLLMLLWQVFGERGRHLVNKGNLLDGNCNIEEKELKLQNRDNAI
jgi:hypothetical protein